MYPVLKRIFDIISSLIVFILLSWLFIVISIWIMLDSRGGVFYRQVRVGKDGKEFKLLKFRSMRPNADKQGQLTIGNDNRVTRVGRFIRKTKLDEFPQILNILAGHMSVVGPRPEVPKYVALYSPEQRKVLGVKPGLTDFASIEYFDEQRILGAASDPERAYIDEVMPAKLKLNLQYIEEQSLWLDIRLIFQTIRKIFN